MKKAVIIVLALMLAIPVFGRSIRTNKKVSKTLPKKLPRLVEPFYINTSGGDHIFGPITTYSNRDSEWSATLIDSSLNGYGIYNPWPNPLGYAIDEGYVAVYRQFQGLYTEGATAGYIGASQSEDGEEWFTEQTLNTRYPTGEEEPNLPTASGKPEGRYPSAGYAPDGNPTAIWNEYTNTDHGGGTYGGYPLYTYDSQGIGEFSTWVNPFHINNGCNTTPCDPPDLWMGNSYVNFGGGTPRLTSIWDGWSDPHQYWVSSNFHANGYFILNDAYIITSDGAEVTGGDPLWYDFGNYTGTPDFHINEDGIGYMGQNSYSYTSDTEPPLLHTFWFKKTEDYGETWTSEDGYLGTGYNYINDETLIRLSDSLNTLYSENPEDYPEQLWYPWAVCDSVDEATGDTITVACGDSIFYSNVDGPCFVTPGWFFYYSYDVRTDPNGGLHFVTVGVPMVCPDSVGGCEDSDGDGLADTLYLEGRFGSAGHIYFYNPDPIDQPNNWRATLINDLSETYYADWGTSDIPHLNSGSYPAMYYFYPEITLSAEDGSEVMWYGGNEGSAFTWSEDTMFYYPQDIDIYMRKSTDLGATWTDIENVTNTPGGIFPDKQLEISTHLASTGNDDNVGILFQMPDFYTETLPPSTGYEDYMNRVYVGIYSNDAGGGTVGNDADNLSPTQFTLQQNYPNPFNPITQIKYDLDTPGEVVMDLFDIRGAKVKTLVNESHSAGSHEFTFDGSKLASGVYFYSMTANGINKTRKLVLMK